MPQYAVLVYSPPPADPMALTAEHMESLGLFPDRAKVLGGKVLGGSYFAGERGFAFGPSTTGAAVRGETVTEGPLIEADLVASAVFVLQAPDRDIALRIAQLHPATREGGVEVRPMFVPPSK